MEIWIEGLIEVEGGKARLNVEGNASIIPGEPFVSVEEFFSDFLHVHGAEFEGRYLRITVQDMR